MISDQRKIAKNWPTAFKRSIWQVIMPSMYMLAKLLPLDFKANVSKGPRLWNSDRETNRCRPPFSQSFVSDKVPCTASDWTHLYSASAMSRPALSQESQEILCHSTNPQSEA